MSIRLHGPLDGYSSQLVSYPVLSMGVQYLISDQGELETLPLKKILSYCSKRKTRCLELERQLVESDYSNRSLRGLWVS